MKRLDIVVRKEKQEEVIRAIKKIGVGGVTLFQVQGEGKEDPPLVGQYYTRGMIITVVEDEKVDPILKKIGEIACTGEKGDGKVFISDIEEVMDICTRECGHKIL